MDPVDAFWDRCAEATAALEDPASPGLPALEGPARALVELVAGHPGDRARLADCFLRLASGDRGPWELVAPCMAALRWPEVRDGLRGQLDAAIASNDWRAIPVLHHLLGAFEEGWPDADLYPGLTSPGGGPRTAAAPVMPEL